MSLQLVLIIVGCSVILFVYFAARLTQKKNRQDNNKNSSLSQYNRVKDRTEALEAVASDEATVKNGQLDLPISEDEEQQLGLFTEIKDSSLNTENVDNIDEKNTTSTPSKDDEVPMVSTLEDNNIIKVFIKPRKHTTFDGPDILRALNHVGMHFGEMNVFHKKIKDETMQEDILFSVANMFEPGTFNLQKIEAEKCLGLVFFMKIPTLMDDGLALESFLDTVERVAATMKGELYKSSDQVLDKDYIDALRLKMNFIVKND